MPNSTEQKSSSDDLIAELARLMAEEAQGQGDSPKGQETAPQQAAPAQPTPAPAAPAAEPGQRLPEGDNVVRIPGARPASAPSASTGAGSAAPAGSVWGRTQDTPAPANSDVKPEPADDRLSDSFGEHAPHSMAPTPETEQPGAAASDRINLDDDAFFAALNQPAVPQDDTLDIGAVAEEVPPPAPEAASEPPQPDRGSAETDFDPIAALIAEQEREDAAHATAMPDEPVETPVPVEDVTPTVEVRPMPAPRQVTSSFAPQRSEAPRPASTPAPTAQPAPAPEATGSQSSEDDVLSLLRAMSETRQPQSTQRPAQDQARAEDRFDAPPAFGLSQSRRPSAPAPSDPLDEIESLIGDAVRLSHEDQRQAAAPAAPEENLDDAAYAAEAAIAAAAAESERPSRPAPRVEASAVASDTAFDAHVALDRDVPAAKPKAKPLSNRLVIGAAAAATILVAVALGLFWMFGSTGETTSGNVPVLTSNTADAKQPVEQNTTTSEASQPAMFNELDGTANANTAPADEQIVSRDQSTDMAAPVRQVATPETADAALANRKVRTVTVRPDGTIVSNDNTVAGNAVLPVTRPEVPALSSDNGTTPDFQVTTASPAAEVQAADAAAASAGTNTAAANTTDPLAGIVNSAVAESQSTATQSDVVANAPYPAVRPPDATFTVASAAPATTTQPANTGSNTIDLIAGAANQVASQLPTTRAQQTTSAPATTTTAAPAATTTATAGSAPAYVQLSSQRSQDAANATLQSISERYKGMFNGAQPVVRQVDLGDRGTYYRVLVPANSLNDAAGICASVKAAGGDCFVRNN